MAYDAKPAEKTIAEEAGLPENWVPIDVAPIIPSEPPRTGILGDGSSKYATGSLPPGYQSDTSFVGTAAYADRVPQLSLMPLGFQGNPASNAAIQSTAGKLIARIPAPAAVVPPAADLDDGLVHGDAIWETDSAYTMFRDEFLSGNTSGGGVGSLGWILSSNAGATLAASYQPGLAPIHIGEFCWANSTVNNSTPTSGIGNISILGVASQPNTSTMSWALLGVPSWKATFIWRFHRSTDAGIFGTTPNFNKKSVYIGLANDNSVPSAGWSRPPIFIGARYDTDATAPAISDTTIKLEAVQNAFPNGNNVITRNNTQGTVVDTGVTPVEDAYYRLDITCTVAGTVTMSLNGSAPSIFVVPQVTINAGGAGTGVNSGGGQASLGFGTTGGATVNHPFGPGALITVAGFGGADSALNGSYVCNQSSGLASGTNNQLDYALVTAVALDGPVGWSVTGYASLLPIFMYGNDSQAAPATDTMICIDYFSLVWNPGVGAGTGTPDATKSRYF